LTAAHSHISSGISLESLRRDIVGAGATIATPFGLRPLVYADYTASGRALGRIEAIIAEQVLPFYANTHSETSFNGAQTGALREAARDCIRSAINAGSEDLLIFTGSGTTAAVNRLVDMLGLVRSSTMSNDLPDAVRPVVFVGPYEHHSNELPWRESLAEVVRIGLTPEGQIDQQDLADALQRYADRPMKVGSFSAASNVTGILSDVRGITKLLRHHGALACWDYAAGGPYLPLDMNFPGAEIDALFLSPHKFLGGPGTPGVLAVKRHLLQRERPGVIGGGTVAYVNADSHVWTDDVEAREEGGTPAIVESIRCGLVFALKEQVGSATIAQREHVHLERAWRMLGQVPGLQVLGPGEEADRLPIFALRFSDGNECLPYDYIVALLNDLFGIQARGGCSCAGPYGHQLLDFDQTEAESMLRAAQAGEGWSASDQKPGWVRVNFHWVASDEECTYILEAIRFVAAHASRLQCLYQFDEVTGAWRHIHAQAMRAPSMQALLAEGMQSIALAEASEHQGGVAEEGLRDDFSRALAAAHGLVKDLSV
jgi:selenocysteine lyase/cysteine desulfurase